MCFSASASFAAAGAVSVAGVAALRTAKKPSHMLLAAIPLIFAVHQFAEGVLWLALSRVEHVAWTQPAMLTFLTFGEVVWPFWVPLAILALEDDPRRRNVLSALLALGIIVAVARAYGLRADPVSASIAGHHIQYRIDSPLPFRRITDVAYVLVTVLPPFVSSIKLMRWIGLILLASLVVSKIFFYQTFISVWCFFAALMSVLVVLIVMRDNHRTALEGPAAS